MTELLTNADATRIPLPDQSVQCVVTSPPYWGLRKYQGVSGAVWPRTTYTPMSGAPSVVIPGDVECEHVWGEEQIQKMRWGGDKNMSVKQRSSAGTTGMAAGVSQGQWCQRCGAWRGELGLEPTTSMYVAHLVLIFREVRRVLRANGCVFLNLGDSYFSNPAKGGDGTPAGRNNRGEQSSDKRYKLRDDLTPEERAYVLSELAKSRKTMKVELYEHEIPKHLRDFFEPVKTPQLKPKDLCMIPARVALALQADGWWLRSDIPWLKDSAMPESVTDRPTKAHEYLFLLAKSKRYFFDHEAVNVEARFAKHHDRYTSKWSGTDYHNKNEPNRGICGSNDGLRGGLTNPSARNRRTTDWYDYDAAIRAHQSYIRHIEHIRDEGGMLLDTDGTPIALHVNPKPYKGAHYAAFPPDLVEPCIKAGTSEAGACPACGAPYERVVEKRNTNASNEQGIAEMIARGTSETLGWQPTCDCDAGEPVPCRVLDPFAGSGTTGLVARYLNRDAVLLDLSFQYLQENAAKRLELDKLRAWQQGKRRDKSIDNNLDELPMFIDL